MKKNDIISRKMVLIILSFILSILLVISSLLLITKTSIFSEDFLLRQMEDSNYSNQVHEYFLDVLETKSVLYGVDMEYLSKPFSLELINEHVLRSTTLIFNQQTPDFFNQSLKTDLTSNLIDFSIDQDITLTTEVQQGIEELTESIIKDYSRIMQIPLLKNFVDVKKTFDSLFYLILPGLMVFIGLVLLLMSKVFKNKEEALIYFSYSTISTTIMMLIILVPPSFSKFYDRIQIEPQFFKLLLTESIESTLGVSLLIVFAWFTISSILVYMHEKTVKL